MFLHVHYLAFINTEFTCCQCSALCFGIVKSSCNSVQAACASTTMNNLHTSKNYNFILYLPSCIICEDSEHLTPLLSSLLTESNHFCPFLCLVPTHFLKHGRIFFLISLANCFYIPVALHQNFYRFGFFFYLDAIQQSEGCLFFF